MIDLLTCLRRALGAGIVAIAMSGALHQSPAHASEQVMDVIYGKASWYGLELHGRPTASGEVFDAGQLTAAHPTLPFGSILRVTNEANGKAVVVRVNDRGPFTGRRVIDVSKRAAQVIGIVERGVARVKIEVLRRA